MATTTATSEQRDLPKGFVQILVEECKGCELCIEVCPEEQLALSESLNRRGHRYVQLIDTSACTGCTLCYIQCPSSAIEVYRKARRPREQGNG